MDNSPIIQIGTNVIDFRAEIVQAYPEYRLLRLNALLHTIFNSRKGRITYTPIAFHNVMLHPRYSVTMWRK